MTQPITPSGRLELGWTNKHLRLLADESGGYEWTTAGDYRVAEVRLLHGVAEVGSVQPEKRRAQDNLLIRGDALNALTSLGSLPEFASTVEGGVTCAYIDPPFNTQQAFSAYDDALEHSVWLTMMRDRLVQIRDLLAANGSVWVHLDDAEAAYCRVLMDEVFGRANFVATVIWEKADSPRNSARHFSTDQDYILVYAKDASTWRPNRLPRTAASDAIYGNPDGDPRGPWLPGDPYANKPYSKGLFTIEGPSGRSFSPPPGRYWRVSEEKLRELDADGRVWWGPKGEARPSIKRYLDEVSDLVPRTLWRKEDVGSNRTSKNEARALLPGVEAFDTPKPEAFMERVLRIATKPGDLVLDCFAGSGSTAAVAHKMGRRWITIERSQSTVESYTLPRLTKVIEGSDAGGITKALGWSGGGGFRILDVAPSMFAVADERIVLAPWTVGGALSECVAAQAGFAYDPEDQPFAGRKGRQRLAVVDGLVSVDVLELLTGWLDDKDLLTVYGTAVDPACRAALSEMRRGSVVRRIPQTILDDYRNRAGAAARLDWPSISLVEPVVASAPIEVSA